MEGPGGNGSSRRLPLTLLVGQRLQRSVRARRPPRYGAESTVRYTMRVPNKEKSDVFRCHADCCQARRPLSGAVESVAAGSAARPAAWDRKGKSARAAGRNARDDAASGEARL